VPNSSFSGSGSGAAVAAADSDEVPPVNDWMALLNMSCHDCAETGVAKAAAKAAIKNRRLIVIAS